MASPVKKALGCCSFVLLLMVGLAMIVSAFSILLVWDAYAQSSEAASWGLRTEDGGWFDLRMQPGEIYEGVLLAVNNSDSVVELIIKAVDSINGQRGGFSLSLESGRQLTSWLQFPERLITLAPYETLRLPFILEIPQDALPGDYGAGFVGFEPIQESGGGGIQITIVKRSGVSLLLRVAEPTICALEFEGVEVTASLRNDALIMLDIFNSGNLGIKAEGYVRTIGPESEWADALIIDYSLPGPILYPIHAPIQPGAYELEAEVWVIDNRDCRAELSSFFVLEELEKPKPKIQQVIE
jgi:hypothetical protein